LFEGEKMRRQILTRLRQLSPVSPFSRIELLADVRHPQVALRAVFIEQPDTAGMTLGLIEKRLHEDAEKALRVGLAYQQIESELHCVTLNPGHALRATPL